ncbi:helix-turn-helix domain-containing protein [Snodgrassella alvi]|uniref:helix-turn-helix domain-containing protein n=1 Tax=Snodgrassella alvi TaxID=1196083 RepID=UPI00345F6BC0
MDSKEIVLFLKKKGMSNEKIATYVGCSAAYINKIANGTRKNISYKYMDKLRNLLKEPACE